MICFGEFHKLDGTTEKTIWHKDLGYFTEPMEHDRKNEFYIEEHKGYCYFIDNTVMGGKEETVEPEQIGNKTLWKVVPYISRIKLSGLYRYQTWDEDPEFIEVEVKETKTRYTLTVKNSHGTMNRRYVRFTLYAEQTFGKAEPGKKIIISKKSRRLRPYDADTFGLNKLVFRKMTPEFCDFIKGKQDEQKKQLLDKESEP